MSWSQQSAGELRGSFLLPAISVLLPFSALPQHDTQPPLSHLLSSSLSYTIHLPPLPRLYRQRQQQQLLVL